MWRRLEYLREYRICATDGDIGPLVDFYFDDRTWVIRYLVVDAGGWFSKKLVLVPTFVLERVDEDSRTVSIGLAKERIRESRRTESEQTVADYRTSQMWRSMRKSGGFPLSWGHHEPFMIGATGAPPEAIALVYQRQQQAEFEESSKNPAAEPPHLRSEAEIIDYRVHAIDGKLGYVDDFLLEASAWKIAYIVVGTRNWFTSKQVLIPHEVVNAVNWGERNLSVSLRRKMVEKSPEFNPNMPMGELFENQ